MDIQWSWDIAVEALPQLLQGLWITLLATAGGMVLALILGLFLAMLRRSKSRLVSYPVAGVAEFVRSTPLLIQLFFIYFLIPDYGWNTPLMTGIIALGLHYATYTAEVYRSGIDNVPRGQWEAARALNLTTGQTWGRVIVPQAIPPIVPAMGNYLIAMLKDTPLLYAITVQETLTRAVNFSQRMGSTVEAYTMVGILFLMLSLAAAGLIRLAEKKLVIRQA